MPIGNDIVDLCDPETGPGARHPRFDARVCRPAELELLAGPGGDRRRWMLWAAKESAYKVMVQRDPALVFSPVAFLVDLDGDDRGRVTHGGRRLRVGFGCTDERVHAVAYDPTERRAPTWVVEQLSAHDDPSARVRQLAVATVAKLLAISGGGVEIDTVCGVPFALQHGAALPVDLSLSHHGRFAACAVTRATPRELQQ